MSEQSNSKRVIGKHQRNNNDQLRPFTDKMLLEKLKSTPLDEPILTCSALKKSDESTNTENIVTT